jgi:predicted O-linked N-acetylglucosamine transferase (SPINDLY family)
MFSEKLLHLDCYMPTDDMKAAAATPPREALGLPQDAVVLCSMNGAWKLTPQMMQLWCEIVRAWEPSNASAASPPQNPALRSL